jgi:hypothetical protein
MAAALVGEGKDQRAERKVKDAILYAQAAGVIDTVPVDSKRHAKVFTSGMSRQLELAYYELYRGFRERIATELPAAEVVAFMQEHDSSCSAPVFGFGNRDRWSGSMPVLGRPPVLVDN